MTCESFRQISLVGSRPIRKGNLFMTILFPACGPCLICNAALHEGVDVFGVLADLDCKNLNALNTMPMVNSIAVKPIAHAGSSCLVAGGSSGRIAPEISC